MRVLLFLLLFLLPYVTALPQSPAPPQPTPGWQDAFQSWLTAEDAADTYSEETLEFLADLADNPLNLNQLSRSQLEQLPFLSAQQIEELVAYTDRYRPVRSLSELMMLTTLDRDTRRLLSYFVFVGDTLTATPSLSSLFSSLKTTVSATARIPFYRRKGDEDKYLGYPYRHDLRVQFAARDRLKFGITAAQDAGEPFFANRNRWGYDHYSLYFQLRRYGRLEELNLGHYRVSMGMGLVMNTGFHLGKLAILQSLGRPAHVLTAHSSRSALGYLQGAAASVRLAPAWCLTAFASYRPVDATLNDDGTVRTIVTDGYHRTASELAKKHNTHETDLGVRLAWQPAVTSCKPYLDLNAVYTRFDRALVPVPAEGLQAYRRYALAGSSFFNASLDYGVTAPRFSVAGETAVNADGALAALHTFSLRATGQLSLMLLHRYYAKDYTAYHAYAFSEGSSTQNEHGLYLGATWQPSRTWFLQGYIDYAHFPFLRYQVSTPSSALDALFLARTSFKYNRLEARYRFHLRQRDNADHTFVRNRYEHRSRLRYTYTSAPSPASAAASNTSSAGFTAVSQLDAAYLRPSFGWMLTQQATVTLPLRAASCMLHGSFSYFHTDDYDTRLYTYEPSVPHDFSFPSYYGHGIRYAVMASYRRRSFSVGLKLATTDYFDRAVISSGNQQIGRSSQTDLLLHFQFML